MTSIKVSVTKENQCNHFVLLWLYRLCQVNMIVLEACVFSGMLCLSDGPGLEAHGLGDQRAAWWGSPCDQD